jgi:antitoxin (DNA-binding transcriptional repressor) of toxin-antitoxin stability system
MKAVGIRELKNRLSRYVASVRRGEVILVTDRGEVVAQLRAPGPAADLVVPRGLQRLADRGDVTLGDPQAPASCPAVGALGPPGLARRLLDEERGAG